jgi:hypothetical protein
MTPEDIEQLKQLKQLFDTGVLTAEEFELQKQLVLKSDTPEQAPGLVSEPLNDDSKPSSSSIGQSLYVNSVSGGKVSPISIGTTADGKRRALAVSALAVVALIAIVVAVSRGGDDSQSKNPIDERMNVSVRCVVTDLERTDIVDIQEISESETLWTIAGQSYFYFNRFLTVTNYEDETYRVYVEHRFVDDNGKVWGSWNFLEYVNGGETQTFEENRIVDAPTEIVLRGNSATGEMAFDCPVTSAKL